MVLFSISRLLLGAALTTIGMSVPLAGAQAQAAAYRHTTVVAHGGRTHSSADYNHGSQDDGGHHNDGHSSGDYPNGGHPDDGHHGYGYGGHGTTVVVDRGRAGWWHGNPAFAAYVGPRGGYYYAPGYGYYAIPRGYARTTWVVGGTLPSTMRRYVVVNPAVYGLRLPPPGFGWYYAGTNFVLVSRSRGVIVQSVAGGW